LDDPNNLIDTIRLTQSSTIKVAVLAFDPLQVEEDITDDAFEGIKRTYGITTHILGGCYRQKENVGKATKHVIDMIATSTPFLRKDKIKSFRGNRQQLTELANNLNFINPHGYIEYYPNATVNDILHEVTRILTHEWLMWKHWPGLLILLDGVSLTEAFLEALKPLMQKNYVNIVPFNEIREVKGLEYQHVFVFIKKHLFDEIQSGFTGSGQREYHRRRLLRIPFSRAKDSLVTFAIISDD
jgi:hypothetical protein